MSTFLFLLGELLGEAKDKGLLLLIVSVLLALFFLGLFSSFFLLGASGQAKQEVTLAPGEVLARLSPRLSSEESDQLYLSLREREDVERINYVFGQEIEPGGRGGGAFMIWATGLSAVRGLVESLDSIDAITETVSGSRTRQAIVLSVPAQIGILAGLALCAVGSMVIGRLGLGELLQSFAGQIRLMHLSGAGEGTIHAPIVAVGMMCGVASSLLLIVAVYVLHTFAVSNPDAVLRVASGLADSGRVLTVSLVSLALGLVLGFLVGVLGANLTSLPRFRSYS